MRPIIIVSHNNLPLTKMAVKSALVDEDCTVLVIDNASTDGTQHWLRSKDVVNSICLTKQKSLAACWNMGLRAAWLAGAHDCLVLNNDVQIRSDTYYLLERCNLDFVTCVSVNDSSQVGTLGDRSLIYLLHSASPHPDFSAFLINRKVTDTIGWFNEDYYPAYCEDCDYHVRMKRAGLNAFSVDLPFYHAAAQTLAHASEAEQIIIRRGADANRERFRQTYGCLPGTPEYSKLFE
jgi:GT2 family glycosyltransferase